MENGELVVRYAYDKLNRLIREDNKRSGKTHLYSYDNNGNILNKREAYYSINNAENLTEIANVSYLYNKGDRLIGLKTRRRNAIASGLGIGEYLGESGNIGENAEYSDTTSIGFSYDNLGNPKVYRGKELIWINGRQLSKYDGLTFNYDGQGRRIKKGTTEYTYGVNGELLKQSDGVNTIEYIYDNGRAVSFIHNDTQYLYRRNIQGDIISIYGIDSLEKACYTYDSFGNVRVLNPDKTENFDTNFIGNINPIRYRGYYYDRETNLYFCLSRYYDPEIGRFINADDISYLDPESIGGLNLYAYCLNNPVMYTDRTGHFAISIALLGWAVAALVTLVGAAYIETNYHPIENTVSFVAQGLTWLGIQVGNGLQWVFSQWKPGTWPGDDPTVSPGDDFIWRGPGEVGSDRGEWYNPITGDQLHPDLVHEPPKGPHWGWRNKIRKILEDIFKHIGPGGPPTLA